jgi:hypothetical protein
MTNTVMKDDLPAGVTLVSDPSRRHIESNLGTIEAGKFKVFTITVKADTNVAGGTYISNTACFTADNGQKGCNPAIIRVKTPNGTVVCKNLKAEKVAGSDRKYKFTATAETTGEGKITGYKFAFGPGGNAVKDVATTGKTATAEWDYISPGTYTATVTVQSNLGDKTSSDCVTTIHADVTPDCTGTNCNPNPCTDNTNCNPNPCTESNNCQPNPCTQGNNCQPNPCTTGTCTTSNPPKQLPDTGAEAGLGAVFGTGALGYAATAYRRSKRSLVDAVRGVHKR